MLQLFLFELDVLVSAGAVLSPIKGYPIYYETSYRVMADDERTLWDGLVTGSCELLDNLYGRDEDNFRLSRYINVLFGLRSAKVDHDGLMMIRDEIYDSNSPYRVDRFLLQKTIIKDYLGNIDSTLDYLRNLSDAFGKDSYWFERGKLKFDQRINDLRNEVVHEGVPSISFDPGRIPQNMCHADVAGWAESPPVILVEFDLKGEGRWEELGSMVKYTYL